MRYLVHPADILGCGFYRMLLPAYVLKSAGHEVDIMHTTVDDASGYDTIVFQRVHRPGFDVIFAQYRKQNPTALLVMDLDDDLFNLPHIFLPEDCQAFVGYANQMDKMIVSTEFLKQRLIAEGVTVPIHVRPNLVSLEFWTEFADVQPKLKKNKRKILLAGAMGHRKNGDLHQILPLPKKLAKGHMIGVMGDELKKDWDKHRNVVFIPWARVNEYPTVVRIINADFWVAPLNPNLLFNKSKSNIKYLEATMAGAILCSRRDSPCYQDLPGVLYYDTLDELARRIDKITDAEMADLYKQAARNVADNYLLETELGLKLITEAWSK